MSDRKEYMRKWRLANRARLREKHREWLAAQPGYDPPSRKRWTDANRGRVNAQSRAWYRRNKAAVLAATRRRQARQKAALCACCAPVSFQFIYLQARGLKMEVDHVRPLSKGGKHCLRNLQLLEPHVNRTKSARWAA